MKEDKELKKAKTNFIVLAIIGILLIAFGGYIWFEFYQLEIGAIKEISAPRTLIGIYDLAGKWGLLVFFAIAGIGCIFSGKKEFDKKKKELE